MKEKRDKYQEVSCCVVKYSCSMYEMCCITFKGRGLLDLVMEVVVVVGGGGEGWAGFVVLMTSQALCPFPTSRC